jgi:hypothetical protein
MRRQVPDGIGEGIPVGACLTKASRTLVPFESSLYVAAGTRIQPRLLKGPNDSSPCPLTAPTSAQPSPGLSRTAGFNGLEVNACLPMRIPGDPGSHGVLSRTGSQGLIHEGLRSETWPRTAPAATSAGVPGSP